MRLKKILHNIEAIYLGTWQSIIAHLNYFRFFNYVSESVPLLQSASQVHGGQFAAGFVDGSIRIFDIRTPEM